LTYDGANPALYVSQGTLELLNNAFVINTTNSLPLTNGVYMIAQQAAGSIGSGPPYTVSGSAIPGGATTSIVASNNVLFLAINTNYSLGSFTNSKPAGLPGLAMTCNTNYGYYFLGYTNAVGGFYTANDFVTNDSPNGTPRIMPGVA